MWVNRKGGVCHMIERLDREADNSDWKSKFLKAFIENYVTAGLDHYPSSSILILRLILDHTPVNLNGCGPHIHNVLNKFKVGGIRAGMVVGLRWSRLALNLSPLFLKGGIRKPLKNFYSQILKSKSVISALQCDLDDFTIGRICDEEEKPFKLFI